MPAVGTLCGGDRSTPRGSQALQIATRQPYSSSPRAPPTPWFSATGYVRGRRWVWGTCLRYRIVGAECSSEKIWGLGLPRPLLRGRPPPGRWGSVGSDGGSLWGARDDVGEGSGGVAGPDRRRTWRRAGPGGLPPWFWLSRAVALATTRSHCGLQRFQRSGDPSYLRYLPGESRDSTPQIYRIGVALGQLGRERAGAEVA